MKNIKLKIARVVTKTLVWVSAVLTFASMFGVYAGAIRFVDKVAPDNKVLRIIMLIGALHVASLIATKIVLESHKVLLWFKSIVARIDEILLIEKRKASMNVIHDVYYVQYFGRAVGFNNPTDEQKEILNQYYKWAIEKGHGVPESDRDEVEVISSGPRQRPPRVY